MRPHMHIQNDGFSLIELSVATAIYSMGLGSLSLMLMLAVHGTSDARYESIASVEVSSLAETIAMSSDAVGHYIDPTGAETCLPADGCPAEMLAAWSLAAWKERIAAELPEGGGTVCRDSTPNDGDTADNGCDGSGGPVVKAFWSTPGQSGEGVETHRRVARLPLP